MNGGVVSVIGDGQHRGAIAVSDPSFGAVDDLQFSLGEGPCIDADRAMAPVLEPDLRTALAQWPVFAPAALERGVRAAFSFPLRVGAVGVGVMSLYRCEPVDLDETELRDAIVLSRIATQLLLVLQTAVFPGSLPDHLADVVATRAHVHQATGMIAVQLDTDVGSALARLRAYAWSSDRTIDDVASQVVDGSLRFDTK